MGASEGAGEEGAGPARQVAARRGGTRASRGPPWGRAFPAAAGPRPHEEVPRGRLCARGGAWLPRTFAPGFPRPAGQVGATGAGNYRLMGENLEAFPTTGWPFPPRAGAPRAGERRAQAPSPAGRGRDAAPPRPRRAQLPHGGFCGKKRPVPARLLPRQANGIGEPRGWTLAGYGEGESQARAVGGRPGGAPGRGATPGWAAPPVPSPGRRP